ncbi:MAG: GFA family protein [Aquificaceae bacterium]|nr:MAG: GFA family protein [Aquificaceae bacterium]
MGNKTPYYGQCLCGEIQYEVDIIEPRMAYCHCIACRKFHGAAFSTFGEAKSENFRWVKGESLLKRYIAENGAVRQFCKNCGASMTFATSKNSNDVIEFALGTLDSDIELQPDAHLFTRYKANWSMICDGLPQHKEGRN